MGVWQDTYAPYQDTNGNWIQRQTLVQDSGARFEGSQLERYVPASAPQTPAPSSVEPTVKARSTDVGQLLGMKNLNQAEANILGGAVSEAVSYYNKHGRWPE